MRRNILLVVQVRGEGVGEDLVEEHVPFFEDYVVGWVRSRGQGSLAGGGVVGGYQGLGYSEGGVSWEVFGFLFGRHGGDSIKNALMLWK